MKLEIETHLKILIGQPLISANRAASMQMFGFGKWVDSTEGEPRKVGEYALHLQCAWRIVSASKILVASRDMFYPNGNPYIEPEDWKWEAADKNRCDERISLLFQQNDNLLIVKNIVADEVGSLILFLNEDVKLEIFPNDSLDDEHWRFFKPAEEEDHFVVCGNGIEV